MNLITTALATMVALMNGAAMAAEECELPPSYISSENDLPHVAKEIKHQHRLNIVVVGTGSSTLPGPDGPHFAYPQRLQDVLKSRLPGNEIKLTAHIKLRQTAAELAAGLNGILADDKPALVIWQTGTFDAESGVGPEEFSASLGEGVKSIAAAGADVDLVNMQYSPRTDSMLNISAYAEVMRWVAQEHGTLLFDRLEIMRYWSDQGIFDLYAATKKYDMARRVHQCIGRVLAAQIIDAAHLTP